MINFLHTKDQRVFTIDSNDTVTVPKGEDTFDIVQVVHAAALNKLHEKIHAGEVGDGAIVPPGKYEVHMLVIVTDVGD